MARTPARKAAPLDLDALRGDRSRDPSWCWLLAGPRRGQSLPGRTLSRMQPGPPSVPGRHPPSGRCLAVSSAASKRSAGLAKVVGGGRYIRRGTSARSRSQSCQYAHRRGHRGSGSCARSHDSCRHRPAQWSLGEAVPGRTTALKYVLDYLPESDKKPAQAHCVPRMAIGGGGHRRAAVRRSFRDLRRSVEALPGNNLWAGEKFSDSRRRRARIGTRSEMPHVWWQALWLISRPHAAGPPKGQSLEERPPTGSLQAPAFSHEDQYFGRCDSGHFLACSIGGRSAVALRSCCTVGNASIRSRQACTTGNLGYIVWPSRLRPNEYVLGSR